MLLLLGMLKSGGLPLGPIMAIVLFLFAALIAGKHYYAYRYGYMYTRFGKVYKRDEPGRFKFWLVINALSVLILLAMCVYMLLT
jgi:hypothetical protein